MGGTMLPNHYNAFTPARGGTPTALISLDAMSARSKQDNGDVFDGLSYQDCL